MLALFKSILISLVMIIVVIRFPLMAAIEVEITPILKQLTAPDRHYKGVVSQNGNKKWITLTLDSDFLQGVSMGASLRFFYSVPHSSSQVTPRYGTAKIVRKYPKVELEISRDSDGPKGEVVEVLFPGVPVRGWFVPIYALKEADGTRGVIFVPTQNQTQAHQLTVKILGIHDYFVDVRPVSEPMVANYVISRPVSIVFDKSSITVKHPTSQEK